MSEIKEFEGCFIPANWETGMPLPTKCCGDDDGDCRGHVACDGLACDSCILDPDNIDTYNRWQSSLQKGSLLPPSAYKYEIEAKDTKVNKIYKVIDDLYKRVAPISGSSLNLTEHQQGWVLICADDGTLLAVSADTKCFSATPPNPKPECSDCQHTYKAKDPNECTVGDIEIWERCLVYGKEVTRMPNLAGLVNIRFVGDDGQTAVYRPEAPCHRITK